MERAAHIFATYSRAYLDREFRQASRPLLLRSLAFLAIGPALLLGFRLAGGPDAARAFAVVFIRSELRRRRHHGSTTQPAGSPLTRVLRQHTRGSAPGVLSPAGAR